MALYKRGDNGNWWASIYIPGSATHGQPRRYLRASTGTTDKIKASAIEQTLRLGLHRSAPGQHLHALIDALLGEERKSTLPIAALWSEYMRIWSVGGKRVAERTQATRERIARRLIDWLSRNRPSAAVLADVDKLAASAYAEALKREGAKSKTRKNIIGELSAMWQVVGSVHDMENPWRAVAPEVDDAHTGKAFSRAEEMALLTAADNAGHDWGLMCRVARMTGLRYGDVAALTQSNIDRSALAIRLVPSKTSRHKIAVVIPITQELLNLIPDHPGPLFAEAFECLPRQMWRCPFANVLEAAGLAGRGYTFHSWRHTFRTRLSEAGVADDIARRLGGWTQNTTAQRYDHAERLNEMRQAIEASQSGTIPDDAGGD